MKTTCYRLVKSFLGDVGIVWHAGDETPVVVRVMLPHPDSSTVDRIREWHPDAVEGGETGLEGLCDGIRAGLEGGRVDLPLDEVAIDRCRGFQRKVLYETARIPRGRVTSYGALAEAIHAPGAARAVGSALATNPFPLIIPCHRVVRAGGFVGQFGGGTGMKKALLGLEGVEADDRGKIPPAFFR